jgi:hypothetical protein
MVVKKTTSKSHTPLASAASWQQRSLKNLNKTKKAGSKAKSLGTIFNLLVHNQKLG